MLHETWNDVIPLKGKADSLAMAARYGEAGRRVVEGRFTVPIMVEKTLAVYRELLAG